jgi:hypothetical protein
MPDACRTRGTGRPYGAENVNTAKNIAYIHEKSRNMLQSSLQIPNKGVS